MRAVGYKRGKERHDVKEYVSNTIDDGVQLLALIERVPQARVDSDDIMNIPKYLLDKVGATRLRYYVLCAKRTDPHLRIPLVHILGMGIKRE